MWEFVKAYPWTFAAGGLILVLAIAGVIWGVLTKGRWKDAGFLRTDDGKHPLKWELVRFPLSVWLDTGLDKAWQGAFVRLRGHVKQVVGRELFDLGTPIPEAAGEQDARQPTGEPTARLSLDLEHLPDGHVALIRGQETGGGAFQASTVLKWDTRTGAIKSAVVKLPWPVASEYVWPIVLHEVGGHVLGLDHDEHVASVMHPQIQNRPQGYTDKDKELLRATYGSKEA